jgi:predicted GH43/DUF377 family glycosyl hydrolase
MASHTMNLQRSSTLLRPDQSRVLLRPFHPGGRERMLGVIDRVLAIPKARAAELLAEIAASFSERHDDVEGRFLERFEQLREMLPAGARPSATTKRLMGSYFLAEYSLESAALFNPSIVPHPDQAGAPPGGLRFVLSLRATGEGHVSSLTFRTGTIHADNRIAIDTPTGFLTEPRQIPNPVYEKGLFTRKLVELGLCRDVTRRITDRLTDSFALANLRAAVREELSQSQVPVTPQDQAEAQSILTLALSNYEVRFRPGQQFSQRILFPASPSQSNGIEDARFVRFQNEDGSRIHYATFTAYDGRVIMPELVETTDFLHFRFLTLNGPAAQNKGMALFPRKIAGRYAMLSRQDNENIFLMFSENVHFWNKRQLLLQPAYPWELVQIGNCGSPIETEAGWLVLSHGVGPMRTYSIAAFLLDRDDPSKIIGRMQQPLLRPNASEREGYVPNVVYTCGALLHKETLIIPYALADHATGFATVAVGEVLAAMV